jgi:hypothetical protein
MDFNKTDDELKQMSEDELMAYLDAKAAHLSKHVSPLSPYLSKRYAYIGNAISKGDVGTDEIHKDMDYEKIVEIARKNGEDALSLYLKRKNDEDNQTPTNDKRND